MERNLFLPSLTTLIGFRTAKGLEFGIGPNLSVSGAAIAVAGGFNIKRGEINFPINLAITPTSGIDFETNNHKYDGVKISLLAGFNGPRIKRRKSK